MTPEDWDGLTEEDFQNGVPVEEVIAELEAAQNEADQKDK